MFCIHSRITEKKQESINKSAQLIGIEKKNRNKHNPTPVIWPKSKNGLNFVEIVTEFQENAPELFLRREGLDSDVEEDESEEEEENDETEGEEARDGDEDSDKEEKEYEEDEELEDEEGDNDDDV